MDAQILNRLREFLSAPSAEQNPRIYQGLEHFGGAIIGNELKENHKKAAVLIPIIKRGNEYSVIFTKRSGNLRKHSGQNSFPGGTMDVTDTDLIATALRESHEEIGLLPQNVEVLGVGDVYFTRTNYAITPIIGLLDESAQTQINPDEVEEIFEIPLQTIFKPNGFELRDYHIRGETYRIYTINYGKHQIWGISCAIIRMICDRIFDDFEL